MLAFIDGLLVVFHQIFITGNQAKLKNEQGLTGSPGHDPPPLPPDQSENGFSPQKGLTISPHGFSPGFFLGGRNILTQNSPYMVFDPIGF